MKNATVWSRKVYQGFWPVFYGITLVILGLVVMAAAGSFTIGIAWLMGIAFVFSGLVQVVHAFQLLHTRGRAGRFLLAALSLIGGVIMLRNPLVGAEGITLLLTFYLLFGGIAKGFMDYELGKTYGRSWLICSSVVSVLLGGWLIATLPVSSLFIPGTLLGVDLFFQGFSLAFYSSAYRTEYFFSEPVLATRQFRKVS